MLWFRAPEKVYLKKGCLPVALNELKAVMGNAPRAAAQRQRRTQHEVVQVADAALRGRRVDEDTAGLHARGEAVNQILAGDGVQVDRRGVAVAAVSNQVLRTR